MPAVREPALILIVDDHADNREILEARLASQGYATAVAADGVEALDAAKELRPDLILLDVMMPRLDGLEVCRRLKADASLPYMPIILVTAKTQIDEVVAGLDAGADEYLTKPVEQAALVARVRSILRTKRLHDQVNELAIELADWNRTLEQRVASQVEQIERLARLRRFLAPQVADVIMSSGGEALLESHRREVVVLFCDLRGFTAFAEQAPPDQVMQVVQEYYEAVGTLIHRHDGTLESFLGDGMMVVLNDPIPCDEPELSAVRLGLEIRDRVAGLAGHWRARGFVLGCGIGIARGEATLGQIGFEGRYDYTAIGRVTNLASRLCAEAADGEILISDAVEAAVCGSHRTVAQGARHLKGFSAPVLTHAVMR